MAQVQEGVPWMVVHPRRQVWFFRTCHKDGSPSYIDPTPISRCHQSRCLEILRSPARGKWNFDHVLCVTAAAALRPQSYRALILLLLIDMCVIRVVMVTRPSDIRYVFGRPRNAWYVSWYLLNNPRSKSVWVHRLSSGIYNPRIGSLVSFFGRKLRETYTSYQLACKYGLLPTYAVDTLRKIRRK